VPYILMDKRNEVITSELVIRLGCYAYFRHCCF